MYPRYQNPRVTCPTRPYTGSQGVRPHPSPFAYVIRIQAGSGGISGLGDLFVDTFKHKEGDGEALDASFWVSRMDGFQWP